MREDFKLGHYRKRLALDRSGNSCHYEPPKQKKLWLSNPFCGRKVEARVLR
jgi:hypothetical protein